MDDACYQEWEAKGGLERGNGFTQKKKGAVVGLLCKKRRSGRREPERNCGERCIGVEV